MSVEWPKLPKERAYVDINAAVRQGRFGPDPKTFAQHQRWADDLKRFAKKVDKTYGRGRKIKLELGIIYSHISNLSIPQNTEDGSKVSQVCKSCRRVVESASELIYLQYAELSLESFGFEFCTPSQRKESGRMLRSMGYTMGLEDLVVMTPMTNLMLLSNVPVSLKISPRP